MADPKVKLKRSAVAGRIPSPDQVPLGELALNTWDGQLYASKNVGLGTTVVAINPWVVGTGTDTYNAYFTAGNVGIGLTVPTSTLHVSGDGLFTDSVTIGSAVTMTAGGVVAGLGTINYIDATHINATGVVTATSFSGDGSALTGINEGFFVQNQTGIHTLTNIGIGTTSAFDALTVVGNANISGVSTFTGEVSFGSTATFGNDDRLRFGDSNEFDIYYSGGKSFIKSGVGQLRIKAASTIHLMYENLDGSQSESYAKFSQNGASELYYDGSKTFETISGGIDVTGHTETDTLNVSGVATASQAIVGSAVSLGAGGIVAGLGTVNYINATHLNAAGVVTATSFVGPLTGNADTASNLTGSPSITVTNITANGNITIGGTLTYDDVTNVDSIGLVTARSGVHFGLAGVGGSVSGTGNVNFAGIVTAPTFSGNLTGNVTGNVDGNLNSTGVSTAATLKVGSAVTMTSGGIVAGLGTVNYVDATHLNATGVVTASSFVGTLTGTATGLSGTPGIAVTNVTGFGFLRAPHSATTTVFKVTVASKDATHRYNGTGSGSGYLIDGVQSPFLTLTPGRTYRFDQSDSSNGSHPLRFYLEVGKTTQYSTNVTTNGTAGSAGAYTEITVTDTTPSVLHYQCTAHANMGNAIFVSSNALTSPHEATIKNYLTVDSGTTLSGVTTLTTATATSVVVGSAVTLNSGGVVAGLGTFNSFRTTQLSVSGIATVTSGGVLGNIQVGKTGANEIDTSSGGLTIDSNGGVVTVDDYLGVNQGLSVTGISTLGHTIAGSAVTMTSGGVVAGLGTINYVDATHLNATGVVTANSFVGDGSQLTGITGGVFATNQTGINTSTNIGIGTTSAFNALQVIGDANISGVVTANAFVGDGSGLTGVTGTGSGIAVKDGASTVGTAGTVDFGTALSVTPLSVGIVTVNLANTAVTAGDYTNADITVDAQGRITAASNGSGGGGSGTGFFVQNQTGIHTIGNVGIGTTTANGAADSNNTTVLNAGIVTANYFYGDGSNITGVVAESSGIVIRDSNSLVGTAATVNFGTGLSVTPLSVGIVTVSSLSRTSGVDRTETSFTATAGQTSFTVSYDILNPIDVFLNGIRLKDTTDYTATNGTSIVLTSSAAAGDSLIVMEYFATTGVTNEKHSVDRKVTEFNATAGQTTFSVNYTAGNIDVFFNGVRLLDSDVTASNGTSVVLGSAASAGDQVVVVEYIVTTSGSGITGQTVTQFTATAGQTSFSVSYIIGAVQVYRNGIRLVEDSDYSANTGTSVVLTNGANVDDSIVVVESLGLFDVNQTGIVTTSNLGIGTTSAFDALSVVGDANISGVLTATTLYGNGANLTGIQAGFFVQNQTGIHTTGNIGVGTTSAFDALSVVGDANISGVVTASAFYGDGSNLDGVVSGVGIGLSTYNVGYAQTTIEFIGSGVTAVSIGNTTQVTIEPGLVGAAKSVTSFTATAGQTAFNVDHSNGQENVFLNGVRLSESQYTTNGSTITLNDAAALGDILDIVVYLRGSDANRNIEVNLRPPFNGVTTAFTMYRGTSDTLFDPVDQRQILVSLGGVVQHPGIAYTVGAGSSLYFAAAPGAGVTCFITGLFSTQSGITTDATKIETQVYSPTGVQTSFTLTRGYEQNYLDVYVNGARLVSGQDYTATDSSTFSLTSPASAGDTVEAVAFRTVGITSAVTAGISSNVNGDYVNTNRLTVAGIATFSDKVGIGSLSASGTDRVLSVTKFDTDCFISVRSNIDRDAGILFGDGDGGARGQVKYENNTNDMLLFTDGTERLRITNNGVGIGTTVPFKESGPSNYSRLSVGLGTTGTFEALTVWGGSDEANHNSLQGSANLILQSASEIDESYTIIRGRNLSGSTTGAIKFINQDVSAKEGNIAFGTRNSSGVYSEKVRITGIGSVGIGTTRPIADLQVSGRVFIGDDYQDVTIINGAPGDTATRPLEAQFTIGGNHNAGFNPQNKYKLLITGSDNDISDVGVRTYPIYVEDENADPLFNIQVSGQYRGVGIGTTIGRGSITIQENFDSTANYPVGSRCGIRIADEKLTATEGAGGSIIFSYTYIDDNASPLGLGPYIKGYKSTSDSGHYGGGLSFGTRVNSGTQEERLRIKESGRFMVGLNTSANRDWIHHTIDIDNSADWDSTGNVTTNTNLRLENLDQSANSNAGIVMRSGIADVKLLALQSSAGTNTADFVMVSDVSGTATEVLRYDGSADSLRLRRGSLHLDTLDQSSPNATFKVYIPQRGTADTLEIRNPANDGTLFKIYDSGEAYLPNVYADTVTGRDLYISSSGQLGYQSSVGAAKTNVESLSDVSWLYNLSPVSFNYRKQVPTSDRVYTDEHEDELEYGLIAEQVEPIAPELCFYDEVEEVGIGSTVVGISTELRGIHYRKLITPMLKALQDANARITALEAQVSALQGS